VREHLRDVDTSRAVALGASYGGYMVNWMQGHELGRRFRALVCHDGIFSMNGLLATEELYFPFYDLGGTPWYDPPRVSSGKDEDKSTTSSGPSHPFTGSKEPSASPWTRNDPSLHLSKWHTPQLIIHNSKDYRLPISEGLAAFNVLQARGIPSRFLTFPDENHFVLKPENSLVWHRVVLDWINKHVGLPRFSGEGEVEEDVDGEERETERFFGGRREGDGEVVQMVGMGKPET